MLLSNACFSFCRRVGLTHLSLLILFSGTVAHARKASASQDFNAYYRGIAVSGSAADFESSFPHLNRVGKQGHPSCKLYEFPVYDELFRDVFTDTESSANNCSLKFGVSDGHEKRVFALVFTGEDVSYEVISGQYKYYITLVVDLMVLDFDSKTVVANQPFSYEKLFLSKAVMSDEALEAKLLEGLRGDAFKSGIRESFSKLRLRDDKSLSCRIMDVGARDAYVALLPKRDRENIGAYKQRIAAQYGAMLASRLSLPMLPYCKDAANASMSLAFSDSECSDFAIPEPTYGIGIDLVQFKKVPGKESPVERQLFYGAFMDVKIYLYGSDRVYFEESLKKGHSEIFPKSMTDQDIDDQLGYRQALRKLLEQSVIEMRDDKKFRKKVQEKCVG